MESINLARTAPAAQQTIKTKPKQIIRALT